MIRGKYFSIALLLMLAQPALGQDGRGGLICCNHLIDVGGAWVTADRNCLEYMQQYTTNRVKVCANPWIANMARECAANPAPDAVDTLLPAAARESAPTSPVTCCEDVAALCGDNNCKDFPARFGNIYIDREGGAPLHSEPSRDAPVVATHPAGAHRVPYAEAVRVGGKTWFRIPAPSGSGLQGWVSSDDIRCKRGDLEHPRKSPFFIFSRWLIHWRDEVMGDDIIGTVPTGVKA
jgi:hypothetical protein